MKLLLKITASVFVFGILTSFAPESLPKPFTDLLSRGDMMFEGPEGWTPAKLVQNHSMNYEYALKYPGKNFEVRFAIRPTDNLWKEYYAAEKNKKPGDIHTNPDSMYMSALQTIILNTSPGEFPEIKPFDKDAVKAEFGADWGATVFVHPRKEFGQDYKFCMIVAIHKNKAGDAYVFYLSDSSEQFNELVAPAFHALKFNSF